MDYYMSTKAFVNYTDALLYSWSENIIKHTNRAASSIILAINR